MSTTIDERVVEMRFDNKHFESNVKTTMSTLDKLKEKLHLNGASKGLENVGTAAKNVNMSGLGSAVETVSAKFSALQVMGVTALANITNSAVNAGKRMVSALTIDPIKTGFSEYETKINSIQTIMSNTASKGTTMEDVTRVINELNTYADKTIYNFAEMTRNIGTFTAAGVGLEESAAAIQGIANLAAASGSTSQQASTAMYQLSQAISTGTVRLMDWNSVVNAGMGGELFQEAIKDTAREYGVAVDDIIEKNGSFRDSLQEEWLTADILNTTLKKFTTDGAKEYAESMVKSGKYTQEQADALLESAQNMEDAATKVKTFTQLWDTLKEAAQSGWSQTWELIFGDFEEAKDFFTGLSDTLGGIINASSEARNKMLGGALGSKWETFTTKINEAGIATEDFEKKLRSTAKENGVAVDDLIKKHGSLAKAIEAGAIPTKIITKTLKKFAGISDDAGKSTEDMTDKLEYFQKVVDDVWRGDYGDGEERVKALTEAGYDYATVQDLVNKTVDGHRLTIEDLSDAQLENLGYTDEQIKSIRELAEQAEKTGTPLNELIADMEKPSGRQLLIESLQNILQSLIDTCGAVKKAWREVFWGDASEDEIIQRKSNMIYKLIEAIHKFTTYLTVNEERSKQLVRTFKGVFAILDIILTIVGGPLKMAFKAILKVFNLANVDILELTARAGDAIVAFRDWIDENNIFVKVLEKIGPFLEDAIKGITDWVKGIKEADNIPKYIIQGLVKGLKAGVMAVGEAVVELGKSIINTIKRVLGIHSPSTEFFEIGKNIIQGLINGLKSGASAVWEFIKKIGLKGIEVIKGLDFGTIFAGVLSIGALSVLHTIGKALSALASPLEGLGDLFENTADAVKLFSKGMNKVLNAKAFELNSKAIVNIALSIAILAGSIYLLSKLDAGKLWSTIGAIAALAAILALLTVVMNKFGGLMSAGNGLDNAKSSYRTIANLAGIAAALLLAAIALKKLADIDINNVPKALGLLAGIIAGLSVILLILSKLVNSRAIKNVGKVGSMMISMSVAILLMTFVIKQVAKLNPNEVGKGIVFIAGFGILLRGLIAILNSSKTGLQKVGGTLIAISVAILLMIGIIKIVSKMDPDALSQGLKFVAAISVLFIGIIAVTKLAGEHSSQAGTALIKMAAAIMLLVVAVRLISAIDPSDLDKGLKVIIKLELMFAALIVVSKLAGDNAGQVGSMLMKISISLLILTGVIYLLSFLDPAKLTKAVLAIAVLGTIFAGMIAITKFSKDCQKSLISLVVAVGLLGVAITVLSFIDPKRLASSVAAISVAMLAFAVLMKSMESLYSVKGTIPVFLTLSAVVVLLAGLIVVLSMINVKSALENAAALGVLLVAMAASLRIMCNTENVMKKSIGVLALMGLIVLELLVVVGLIDLMKLDNTINAAASISVLLLAMSATLAILSKVGGRVNSMGAGMLALAVMGLVVLELAGIMKAVEAINPNVSLKVIVTLSLFLAAMSGVLVILGFVGALGASAFIGIGALAALIGAMGALLIAIGALVTYVPAVEKFLDAGIPVLLKIGSAIGGFVGAIVGGIIGGVGAGVMVLLPVMGACLSAFMTAIQPFVDGAAKVDASVLIGAGILTAAIILLSASSFIASIATLGGLGLAAIGASLSVFMINATPFIKGAKSMDASVLEGITCLATAILMLTASNLMDGITRWITGGSSLGEFSEQLPALGTNMRQFADNLGTFDESTVETVRCAAEAIKALAYAAGALPNEGGWLAAIVGDNSIDQFGSYLPKLADCLKEFEKGLDGFDKKSIQIVKYGAEAIKVMAEAASGIPNEGGWLASFVGDNNIGKFGSDLASLGLSLNQFVCGLGDFNADSVEKVKCGAEAVKAMAEVAKKIPNEGGLWAGICGDNGISKFGSDLAVLGTNLSDFVSNLGSFGKDALTKVQAAADTITIISNVAKNLPNEGGFWASLCGDNSITSFSAKLPQLGTDLATFASNLGAFSGEQLTTISTAMQVITLFGQVANNDMSYIAKNAGNAGKSMVKFGSDMNAFCSSMSSANSAGALNTVRELRDIAKEMATLDVSQISAVGSSLSDVEQSLRLLPNMLQTSGKASVTGFLSAFNAALPDVRTAGTRICNTMMQSVITSGVFTVAAFATVIADCVDVIKRSYSSFYDAGVYVVAGLKQGISDHKGEAIAEAQSLADRITEIVNKAFRINSPSKVFAQIGGGLIEGLVKGINDNEDDSLTAVTDMANNTTKGFSTAISRVSDMLNGNMDMQPTITPVLDLSNLRTGAGSISDILGGTSVGVLANVGAISSSMNNQNGEGSELISAINKLRKDIGSIGNTTNIINGVTYDDGSNINNAVADIVRAAKIERRR